MNNPDQDPPQDGNQDNAPAQNEESNQEDLELQNFVDGIPANGQNEENLEVGENNPDDGIQGDFLGGIEVE